MKADRQAQTQAHSVVRRRPQGRARSRTLRARRRFAALLVATLVVAVLAGLIHFWPGQGGHGPGKAVSTATRQAAVGVPAVEAGVEPWVLSSPISREAVVPFGTGLAIVGGLASNQSSLSSVSALDPTSGVVTDAGTLAAPVHDAAATVRGNTVFVLGGGSPATVPTIQTFSTGVHPQGSANAGGTSGVAGTLPEPRSDLATVEVPDGSGGSTTYVVGGYDGSNYLPDVLRSTDDLHFSVAAQLAVPVRYPAVVSQGSYIYCFGGQTSSSGSTTATDAIQRVDVSTGKVSVVGHLPEALYGASAFVIDGHLYVAGGQAPGGPTLTSIDAFVPSTGQVLNAGFLPQADAFAGYTTLGSGNSAVGYIVGGEVTSQSGPDQAGVTSGPLRTVISLRPSRYGGPAGSVGAGSPFSGTLLIADRGNDRLITIDPTRSVGWEYPSATMPAPPGGFYFPDDAFFFGGGTGIISNQEDNHTIVEIGYPSGRILWQYGHPGQSGSSPGYLNQPDDAYLLKSGTITVADASNNRILFISPSGQITGQIGDGADSHDPPNSIAYPNGDTPLADGNVLVSEINGSWVDEYTPTGTLVWSTQFPSVNYPSDPQQIGTDLYLMTDYNPAGEGKVIEFTREGQIVWSYDVRSGDPALKKPSLAERLPNGLIMVNDDYRDRVVVIDPTTMSIVWQYGATDVPGTAAGLVSIPDGFDNLLADGITPTHPFTG